jgi:very-short-patch-repair endonuclease
LGARELRKNATPAEIFLWRYLDNKGMCGYKFRRQHPIDGFIIDFYCPKERLAIEIDGKIHDFQKEQDRERQMIIESKGIDFLRFSNTDVMHDTDRVLKMIKRKLMGPKRDQIISEVSPLHEVERGAERSEAG